MMDRPNPGRRYCSRRDRRSVLHRCLPMSASSKRVLHDISGLAVLYPARPCPVFLATDHQPLLRLKHRYSLAAKPFITLADQGQLLLVEIFSDGAAEEAGALAADDPDVLHAVRGRCLEGHQRTPGLDRSSYDRLTLTMQHRRLNRICPLISETSEVYGPRPSKERRRLCAFEGVLQPDTKLAKVSHVPGDHRESVNNGRRGDHGVLGDSV